MFGKAVLENSNIQEESAGNIICTAKEVHVPFNNNIGPGSLKIIFFPGLAQETGHLS